MADRAAARIATSSRPRRLGVLGGSFNPVHLGHLVLALEVRRALRLDRVLLIPAARPPHTAPADLAPARDRLALLRLAVRGAAGLEVSDLELRREGPSFTHATLEELRRRRPRCRFFFIVGQDTLPEVPGWRNAARIPRLSTLVVVPRPPAPGGRFPWPPRAPRGFPVRPVATPPIGISSSEIRRRIRAGEPFAHLVPPGVAGFIGRGRLYR
jgi:nicotinate-nucleotide adenylyltransferase